MIHKVDTVAKMKRFVMQVIDESNEFIVYDDKDKVTKSFVCKGEHPEESFYITIKKIYNK